MTEVLTRLALLQNTKNGMAESNGREGRTYFVIIGHSFGGAVVYSALSEVLEGGFFNYQDAVGMSGHTVGVGDLVVLINPAFEALRYSTLSDMSTERSTYFPGQLPVLAILTSESDEATGVAFPVGRWFSTLFENERLVKRRNGITKKEETIDQGEANRITVGHFDEYITHHLKSSDVTAEQVREEFSVQQELKILYTASGGWENDHPGNRIDFVGSTLTRTQNSAGRNPYMNIRVDKELIPDHNDIYDPRIQSFVQQLILISAQSGNLEQRKQMRPAEMRVTP